MHDQNKIGGCVTIGNYSAFDDLIEGVQIISHDWKYLYVNKVVALQGKSSIDDLIGFTMMEKYPGIEQTEMFRFLRLCMNGRTPHQMINEFQFPDGTKNWFELRMQPVPEGVLVLSFNVTERKTAEELVTLQYVQQLEMKNHELEQFAYIASHDLQEPLNTLVSFVNLLGDEYKGKLDESADTYLNYMSQATGRMSDLIKGLLDYSRLGQETQISEFSTAKILEEVKVDMSSHLRESMTEIHSGNLPDISGFRTEFRLLLQNLISNAIKFQQENINPVIHISAVKEKAFWKFSVQDNGIGIADEHKERIFGIFKRLHSKSQYEGSGIGLAHCKKIVDIHGGKIWVESNSENGSTFYFTIPVKK